MMGKINKKPSKNGSFSKSSKKKSSKKGPKKILKENELISCKIKNLKHKNGIFNSQ